MQQRCRDTVTLAYMYDMKVFFTCEADVCVLQVCKSFMYKIAEDNKLLLILSFVYYKVGIQWREELLADMVDNSKVCDRRLKLV